MDRLLHGAGGVAARAASISVPARQPLAWRGQRNSTCTSKHSVTARPLSSVVSSTISAAPSPPGSGDTARSPPTTRAVATSPRPLGWHRENIVPSFASRSVRQGTPRPRQGRGTSFALQRRVATLLICCNTALQRERGAPAPGGWGNSYLSNTLRNSRPFSGRPLALNCCRSLRSLCARGEAPLGTPVTRFAPLGGLRPRGGGEVGQMSAGAE